MSPFDVMTLQLRGEPLPALPSIPGREIRGEIPAGDPAAERWAEQHPERAEDLAAFEQLVQQAPDTQRRHRAMAKLRERRQAAAAATWAEQERDYQRAAMPFNSQPSAGDAHAPRP